MLRLTEPCQMQQQKPKGAPKRGTREQANDFTKRFTTWHWDMHRFGCAKFADCFKHYVHLIHSDM